MADLEDSEKLLLIGGALALWYFWDKKQKEEALAAALAAQQATPGGFISGQLPPTGTLPSAQYQPVTEATPVNVAAAAAGGITGAILAPVLGPLAPIVGASAAATVQVIGTSWGETFEGNLSTGNVLTDIATFTGPIGWSVLGIGKLLGIDLFGHPLDEVNIVILNAWNSSPSMDGTKPGNVQFGKPAYAVGDDGQLHQITIDPNAAGFSWRAYIAVDQGIIDLIPKGAPISTPQTIAGVWMSGFKPAPRPKDSLGLRQIFGKGISFKVGDSNSLHGSWEADVQDVVNSDYKPGSPAQLLYGSASAGELTAAQAYAARSGRF